MSSFLRSSRWTMLGGVLMAAALLPACGARTTHLRIDPLGVPLGNKLQGIRVAIVDVRDMRATPSLGRHRNHVMRAQEHRYVAGKDPRVTADRLLALVLLAEGAQVVHPTQAQVQLRLNIEELDITTDAPLAGEETFGDVQISLAATFNGQSLGGQRVRRHFSNETRSDPGMLGDALRDALVQAVRQLPFPAPGGMLPQAPPAAPAGPPGPPPPPAPGAPPVPGVQPAPVAPPAPPVPAAPAPPAPNGI